jgi:hypothetical protein
MIQADRPAPGTTIMTTEITCNACDSLFLRTAVTENGARPEARWRIAKKN